MPRIQIRISHSLKESVLHLYFMDNLYINKYTPGLSEWISKIVSDFLGNEFPKTINPKYIVSMMNGVPDRMSFTFDDEFIDLVDATAMNLAISRTDVILLAVMSKLSRSNSEPPGLAWWWVNDEQVEEDEDEFPDDDD